jgi:hypothetical protein
MFNLITAETLNPWVCLLGKTVDAYFIKQWEMPVLETEID